VFAGRDLDLHAVADDVEAGIDQHQVARGAEGGQFLRRKRGATKQRPVRRLGRSLIDADEDCSIRSIFQLQELRHDAGAERPHRLAPTHRQQLRPHRCHVRELHEVRAGSRHRDGGIRVEDAERFADAVALEKREFLEPRNRLGKQRHQELFQSNNAVLEQHVTRHAVTGQFPRFEFHLLELRFRLGARLRLGGPVHLHAAEER
jgi:hypothetical protein